MNFYTCDFCQLNRNCETANIEHEIEKKKSMIFFRHVLDLTLVFVFCFSFFFCYELRFILLWATKATLRSRAEDGIRTRSNEPIASFSFGRIFFLKLANEYHNVLKIVCLLIKLFIVCLFRRKMISNTSRKTNCVFLPPT